MQCRLSKLKASVSNKISDRKIKSSKDILQYYKPTTKSYPCSIQNCTLVILEEVECPEWICSDFPPKNDTTWIVTAVITATLISTMILVSCLLKRGRQFWKSLLTKICEKISDIRTHLVNCHRFGIPDLPSYAEVNGMVSDRMLDIQSGLNSANPFRSSILKSSKYSKLTNNDVNEDRVMPPSSDNSIQKETEAGPSSSDKNEEDDLSDTCSGVTSDYGYNNHIPVEKGLTIPGAKFGQETAKIAAEILKDYEEPTDPLIGKNYPALQCFFCQAEFFSAPWFMKHMKTHKGLNGEPIEDSLIEEHIDYILNQNSKIKNKGIGKLSKRESD